MGGDDRRRTQRDRHSIRSQDDRVAKKSKVNQGAIIKHFRPFLLMAKNNPDYWKSPACHDLRDFVAYRNKHPDTHPLTAKDTLQHDITQPSPSLSDHKKPSLSTNFFRKICKASYYEVQEEETPCCLPKNESFIVQVVGYQCNYEGSAHVPGSQRRIRLNLVDGDSKTRVLGVVTGELMVFAQLQLSRGQPIIRLTEHTVVNYRQSMKDTKPVRRPGILIHQYEFLCLPALEDIDYATKYPMAEIAATSTAETSSVGGNKGIAPVVDPGARAENEDLPTTQFHRDILEFQKRASESKIGDKESTQPLPPFRFCKRENRLCSGDDYGIISKTCIAETFRPKLVDKEWLLGASEVCHFVNKEVESMEPTHKRNVAFWWIATQVYFVKGCNNRKQLPSCIECAVRMAFPNKKGKPY